MDKDVLVLRVLHGYDHVVRTFRRKVLTHRQEVRNAKLTAELDGLGGSKTTGCINENDAKIRAQNGALNGEHALSDVDLTVYDGVDVVSGRDGHARGMGSRDGGGQRGAVWAF